MGLLHRDRSRAIAESEAMDRFIDSLDLLDQGRLLALRAAWRGVDPAARDDAWAEVRAVGARLGLDAGIDAVRERALHWAMRGSNRPPLYHIAADDLVWDELRAGAASAVVDAALAIALGERLAPPARETLIGPWLAATEAEPDR